MVGYLRLIFTRLYTVVFQGGGGGGGSVLVYTKTSHCSGLSLALAVDRFFNFHQSDGGQMVFHCSFSSYFCDHQWGWI